MTAKNVLYAAVGAPVVAVRKVAEAVSELRSTLNKEADTLGRTTNKRMAVWADEGEKVVSRITDAKMVDELTSKVDFDQVSTQVSRLRDQLEDMLATWKASFRPEKFPTVTAQASPEGVKIEATKSGAVKAASRAASPKSSGPRSSVRKTPKTRAVATRAVATKAVATKATAKKAPARAAKAPAQASVTATVTTNALSAKKPAAKKAAAKKAPAQKGSAQKGSTQKESAQKGSTRKGSTSKASSITNGAAKSTVRKAVAIAS